MICATIRNNGTIRQQNPLNDGTCQNLVLLNQHEFELSYAQITPQDIMLDFSWGFGVVMFFWFLGYQIGIAKTAVQKL